ncbi:hypothetical protein [Xanthomonas phage vB_XooS_NR08]|nr:hypothetical protein [Xanthomonas phage vB_XooS_NR08]
MCALILIACTVVAVAIHFGLIRPVMHAIARQREESRRRAALEKGIAAAARLQAFNARKSSNHHGAKLANEREWRSQQ